MAVQKSRIELFIHGETLTFIASEADKDLFDRAEKIINDKINQLSTRTEFRGASKTQFLKTILVYVTIDYLRQQEEKQLANEKIEDIDSQIEAINSQIEKYLNTENV